MLPRQASARQLFAINLRNARRNQGMSQETLAELAGLHRTYVGAIERGERNVSVDNMERLATAVGHQLYELLMAEVQNDITPGQG
jgi:transcriptional regulator with XRE-family HTH domain